MIGFEGKEKILDFLSDSKVWIAKVLIFYRIF